MVEITKFNYDKMLDEMFDLIRDADFVAIDTNVEATGFVMFNEVINPEIIAKGWYKTILEKQTTRSPMDFGVAIFKKDVGQQEGESSSTHQYKVRCYSIPICVAYVEEHDARSESRRLKKTEQRLDIDNIGLEFIQRTQLDLNKVLYGGTPFMNQDIQNEARGYMTKNPDFMVITGKHQTNGILDEYYFPTIIPHLEQADIEGILSRLRGIGKFFDVTAETKKPIIGHNLLVKLIVLYKDFVEYLPQQFSEFLVKLEKVLPQFYDTKYMASEFAQRLGISAMKKNVVQSSDVFDLYRNLAWVGKNVFEFNLDTETNELYADDLEDLLTIEVELERESYCHESGFDACVSGMVFARLAYLAKDEDPTKGPFALDDNFFLHHSQIWRNKMFIQDEVKDFDKLEENMAKCSFH